MLKVYRIMAFSVRWKTKGVLQYYIYAQITVLSSVLKENVLYAESKTLARHLRQGCSELQPVILQDLSQWVFQVQNLLSCRLKYNYFIDRENLYSEKLLLKFLVPCGRQPFPDGLDINRCSPFCPSQFKRKLKGMLIT